MRNRLSAICATALFLTVCVVDPLPAQGISKGVGSFPVAPGAQPGIPPGPPPPPGAPEDRGGMRTGLLASDPASIQQAMMGLGFQARLERDSDGDPMITGRISNSDYWVYFLDCQDGANCKGIQFHSAYILDRAVDVAEMNAFNVNYRYIRAFLNDAGNPRMQMDLLMRDEGMGPETFSVYLDLWRQLIGFWEEHLGL